MGGNCGGKTKVLLLENDVRWVQLPEGFYRVVSGALKPSDLVLCLLTLVRDNRVVWDKAADVYPNGGPATFYGVVIRKGVAVDPVCPRCEGAKPVKSWKYCKNCLSEVREEMRKERK